MTKKQYLILLDVDARKRHCHSAESGKISAFMVQLEIKFDGKWHEVIRYDCAHNYTHRDCMNIKRQTRKVRLFLNYNDALALADDDLNENWEYYRDRFLKGEFPC